MDLEDKVLRIRMIEEEISRRYSEGEMRCPVHLSLGQEAQAVGICAGLPDNALMVSSHRSHAHYLAKGGNLKRMLGEIYGKEAGCSRGYGGSMHLVDWECGFAGSTSIVGGTIPVGVGLAFSDKLRDSDRITAIMLGDAATEEGVFHESCNFAGLHQLNTLFVVEDNDRSCYTPKKHRQPRRHMSFLADAHGLDYLETESQDPYVIMGLAKLACTRLPAILVLKCQSKVEHCGPKLSYQPESNELTEEIKEAFEYARSVR